MHSFLSQTVLQSWTSLHNLFLPSIDLTLAHVGKSDSLDVRDCLLLGPSILANTVLARIVLMIRLKHFMSATFYLQILLPFLEVLVAYTVWLSLLACLVSPGDWGETEWEREVQTLTSSSPHMGPVTRARVTNTERYNVTDKSVFCLCVLTDGFINTIYLTW